MIVKCEWTERRGGIMVMETQWRLTAGLALLASVSPCPFESDVVCWVGDRHCKVFAGDDAVELAKRYAEAVVDAREEP